MLPEIEVTKSAKPTPSQGRRAGMSPSRLWWRILSRGCDPDQPGGFRFGTLADADCQVGTILVVGNKLQLLGQSLQSRRVIIRVNT